MIAAVLKGTGRQKEAAASLAAVLMEQAVPMGLAMEMVTVLVMEMVVLATGLVAVLATGLVAGMINQHLKPQAEVIPVVEELPTEGLLPAVAVLPAVAPQAVASNLPVNTFQLKASPLLTPVWDLSIMEAVQKDALTRRLKAAVAILLTAASMLL